MREKPPGRDQEWLEALFDLHATTVRAYAIRRVGHDAADDVVSEVFATAWRRRGAVAEPALPWLLRTAHHVIAHEKRSLARRLNVRDAVAGVAAGPAPGADSASRVLAESVLAQLAPTDAEILRLAAWEELTPAEIAVVLDLSDSATRSRLMRARQRAQKLLAEPSAAPSLRVVPQLQGDLS
ncbi:RNA polymerase sigma factor [Tessaracoccus sp. HDW20]|uniref:RNA polymerase sigma factor n=1 Tax=Tessaracoccus coleopterorum TaxID=2714950 RepID=UPI0018D4C30A|nr:RNA polymerase sigma factor [Tessaracoccus coleopterorum]NHB84627.1 RNA polymerase sigma factor [Tessaracoccus coleopterorum]